eukprot:COSAG02_NODE_6115_length_3790_cov_1.691412_2_plen_90_part_00
MLVDPVGGDSVALWRLRPRAATTKATQASQSKRSRANFAEAPPACLHIKRGNGAMKVRNNSLACPSLWSLARPRKNASGGGRGTFRRQW